MDYKGQQLSELLFQIIIILFGAVGWVIGYFQQDFLVVFQAWAVGVVISIIVSTSKNACVCELEYDENIRDSSSANLKWEGVFYC